MLPLKTAISGTPTNGAARAGFGQLWDFINEMNQAAEIDVASAATVDLGGQLSSKLNLTGVVTITSFGTNYRGPIFIRFSGAMKITYNSSSLVTPRAQDIVTQAGDTCVIYPKSSVSGTANGWVISDYQRYNGMILAYQNYTPVGNIGVGSDDLMSYSLPANYFSTPGAAVRVKAGGSFANNANSKTVANNWGQLVGTVSVAATWEFEGIMSRASAGNQKFWGRFRQCSTTSKATTGWGQAVITGANSETSPYLFIFQCIGTANNDILQTYMTVELLQF